MKKIAILTATRAEYGLLRPIIYSLRKEELFDISVLVTGTHLSEEFGYTYKEIEKDGIDISVKIDIMNKYDSAFGMSLSMASAIEGFANYFSNNQFDLLIVLGDRYETLAVCCAAANARIPIAHLHGGEITEGAIDDAIRHCISKMSLIHFTSNENHRKRVIQLGEAPNRVYNVGATGVENALSLPLLSREELSHQTGFDLDGEYAVATFHPVTLENTSVEEQFYEFTKALNSFKDIKFIITKSNADAGGRKINALIDKYASENKNIYTVTSLGILRYLSALKYCSFVIGNSSSGIIEAPSFKVPTVNIGNRQKGRMQAQSVINCDCIANEIINAINKARNDEFRQGLKNCSNPYGNGKTSEKITHILKDVLENGELSVMKSFYDIDFKI